MLSTKKMANAVGAKTVRACDSCIKKRARWYCAADDAFLCQSCDSSVHSANPVARRHKRVRLKTASIKSLNDDEVPLERFLPSWERGFTRKARSRRPVKGSVKAEHTKRKNINPVPMVVPEFGSDEISLEENEEEQLLYRVPIYDPFAAELCTSTSGDVDAADVAATHESKAYLACNGQDVDNCSHGLNFPSEMDLAEFAADVETLLGKGLENESFAIDQALGLMDTKEENFRQCSLENGKEKIEDDDDDEESFEGGMAREPFELSFNYDSPASCGVEDELVAVKSEGDEEFEATKKKRKTLLSLNYDSVISAWATQGSPWTSGCRPDFDPDQCWPDCTGNGGTEIEPSYGCMIAMGQHHAMGDGGREARVSRYREKKRTRLFSKKIRYEVRKLNAEKRPRMRGRFVKRASILAGPVFPLINKK